MCSRHHISGWLCLLSAQSTGRVIFPISIQSFLGIFSLQYRGTFSLIWPYKQVPRGHPLGLCERFSQVLLGCQVPQMLSRVDTGGLMK